MALVTIGLGTLGPAYSGCKISEDFLVNAIPSQHFMSVKWKQRISRENNKQDNKEMKT